jgi:hypothetical protein
MMTKDLQGFELSSCRDKVRLIGDGESGARRGIAEMSSSRVNVNIPK